MKNLLKLNLILAFLMSMPNLLCYRYDADTVAKTLKKGCDVSLGICNLQNAGITSLTEYNSGKKNYCSNQNVKKCSYIFLNNNGISATPENIKILQKILGSPDVVVMDLTGNPLDNVIDKLRREFPTTGIIFEK